MSLVGVLQRKQEQGAKVFSVEISPPINYPGLVKTSEVVETLKELELDSIAITNNTGGSFKLNPLAVVETVQASLRNVPIIVHITSRDEGSARTIYTHVDNMALNSVSDVLVIRGDPSPKNSRQIDARFKGSWLEMIKRNLLFCLPMLRIPGSAGILPAPLGTRPGTLEACAPRLLGGRVEKSSDHCFPRQFQSHHSNRDAHSSADGIC